jgi:hypothetical protein
MYRHVQNRNPEAARMLSERISHLSATRDIDIWRWVRTFQEAPPRTPTTETMMPLFMRAVNLIEVESSVAISSELLATLRQSCPSLRALKIKVDSSSREAIAQVGLFQSLTRLEVSISQSWATDLLTDVPSWIMPAVTRFWLQSSWRHAPYETVFMSRCRFPHLSQLDVRLANRPADLQGIPDLCRFLDAHRNIRSLAILARGEWHLSVVPFVRARDFQLSCDARSLRCLPPAFAPLLRREVKSLGLNFSGSILERCDSELTASLSELLAQFAAERDAPPTLERIRLIFNGGDPTAKEKLLSVVRAQAPTLRARGIRIFAYDNQIFA